jgi:hypothetical protein
MSVPDCWIRKDGKGFVVRREGIDFSLWGFKVDWWCAIDADGRELAFGTNVNEAVDNALAKIKGENHV